MKLRLRTELDRALVVRGACPPSGARASIARSPELEAARIGTIHGLCADLLRGNPRRGARSIRAFEVRRRAVERRRLRRALRSTTWFERRLKRGRPRGASRARARRVVETRGQGRAPSCCSVARSLVGDARLRRALPARCPSTVSAAIDECDRASS